MEDNIKDIIRELIREELSIIINRQNCHSETDIEIWLGAFMISCGSINEGLVR